MTTTPSGPSAASPTPGPSPAHAHADVDLRRVNDGLAVIDELRPHVVGLTETIMVDKLVWRGSAQVGGIALASVLGLGALGHTAAVTARSGAWTLTARADGLAQPTVDVDGDPTSSSLGDAELRLIAAAVEASDAQAALRAAASLVCDLRIEINNDPSATRCHWILRARDLEERLNSARWHAAVTALGHGPRTLVVSDLDALSMSTASLLVQGPEAPGVSALPGQPYDTGYRASQGRDGRVNLPSPAVFASSPIATAQPSLVALSSAFNGAARRLAWYWMATATEVAVDGSVTVTYAGARTVRFALLPGPAQEVDEDLALYQWAATGNDPARKEALQHAVSLAVGSAADLATGAAPALRTARTLYELSRRTAITEALAASRSARDAALNAARQAADTARHSAGKSVERALLQVAAAVAVVLSNAAHLLERGQAVVLLLMVAALPIASLAVASRVELKSAGAALDAEIADLDQYREVLASDDIAAVRGIHAISSARCDLGRAHASTKIVYLSSAAAVLIVGILLVLIHNPAHSHSPSAPHPASSRPATISPAPDASTAG